jgi:anti-sigma factor RsiW
MALNPACQTFIPMLSPYIDGELSPAERVNVERHLAVCHDCAARTADLRAESGLVRVGLDMAADEVDFKGFSQQVMARLTPYRPPLLERLRVSLSEMFLYQRTAMLSSVATAAVVALVASVALLWERTPTGYARPQMMVESVTTEPGARVAPVVMTTDQGDAIIWLVDSDVSGPGEGATPGDDDDDEDDEEDATPAPAPGAPGGQVLDQKRPNGGEL